MKKLRCPSCSIAVPMRDSDFPLNCRCGARYLSAAEMDKPGHVRLASPPLPIAEIERRISICQGCEHWNPDKQGCKVCGTCGSGQAMYNGLMKDPAKKCPAPGGSKWGPHLPRPLTVAFLAPSTLLGGAERWIASLCRHFDPAKVWPQAIVITEPKSRSPIVEGWLPKHVKIVAAELLPSIASQVDVLISWGDGGPRGADKGASARLSKSARDVGSATINGAAAAGVNAVLICIVGEAA